MFKVRSSVLPFVVAFLLCCSVLGVAQPDTVVRLGIVTDAHVHDTESPNEGKVMSNYAERLTAFVDSMNVWPADAILQLGDLVNGAFVMGAELGDPIRIPGLLAHGVSLLARFAGPVYQVIGNHDVYDLSKPEYLAGIGAQGTWYSLDLGAFHIVVLDAQFNRNGEDYGHIGWMVQGMIPDSELAWLAVDLAATDKPTIVCVHQPLDVDFSLTAGGPPIFNYLDVRRVLADSGRVIAVFQGHTHDSSHREFDGIHYVTFAAMVDHTEPTPPSWAAVTLDAEARTITIDGVGAQESLVLGF